MRSPLIMAAIAVSIFPSAASSQTSCPVVQVCPLENCPYINSDDNEYKQQVYSKGCADYARSQGNQFISYVSGPAPQCKVVIKIDGNFDCAALK